MKTLLLSMLLLMQTGLVGQTAPKTTRYDAAETVGSNWSGTGFVMTLYHIADNQTTTYLIPDGFYNIDDKWQLIAGTYNVTFTPIGGATFASTKFWVNSKDAYGSGTGSVTVSNVELYEGGGNQVMISPY